MKCNSTSDLLKFALQILKAKYIIIQNPLSYHMYNFHSKYSYIARIIDIL